LIALLGVMFSKQSPGCAIVTDSVTSNGLATFLKENLGLVHVRYLKGYANVINKAKELTQSEIVNAEVAIETSGHCAMKENDYLDDGTYTAVKVVGLLANEKAKHPTLSLLDLIKDMMELDEVSELRIPMIDGSLETTQRMFDFIALEIEQQCEHNVYWTIDQENLEGIRVSTGADGGFFMLRKSLHDPVISLQIEASSKESARDIVLGPLMQMLQMDPEIHSVLHLSALKEY
jgi:phosphomannomutase